MAEELFYIFFAVTTTLLTVKRVSQHSIAILPAEFQFVTSQIEGRGGYDLKKQLSCELTELS
jgi:hypothetical protein